MTADILHYIVEAILSALLAYVALRKAPGERNKDNSSAMHDYIETARIAGEEARQAREDAKQVKEENDELNRRLTIVEIRRFQVRMDFEIGDPPTIGKVEIIRIVPNGE